MICIMNQWVIKHQTGTRMTEQEEFELDEEMQLLNSLQHTASIVDFCAMYYTALTVIAEETMSGMTVVEVHNEMIIERLNEHSELIDIVNNSEGEARH